MTVKSKNIQMQGIKFGMLSAIAGCAVFVIIEQTRLILKFGFSGKTEIEFAILLFFFGSVLTTIPTMIGSSMLSLFLFNETCKNKLTLSKAIRIGAAIGVATSLGISLLGAVLINGRGSLSVYLFHTAEIVIIASFSGGWTGKRLADYIFDQGEFPVS
jgi:hypothetical protein